MPAFPLRWLTRFLLDNAELQALLHMVDAIEKDADPLADREGLTGAPADNLPGVFVENEVVIWERCNRHQSFDEQIGEFYEESELGDTHDEGIEIVPEVLLHEFRLLPFHQFPFGFVGAALGLGGFVGDFLQH